MDSEPTGRCFRPLVLPELSLPIEESIVVGTLVLIRHLQYIGNNQRHRSIVDSLEAELLSRAPEVKLHSPNCDVGAGSAVEEDPVWTV